MDAPEYLISTGIERQRRELSELMLLDVLKAKMPSISVLTELYGRDNLQIVVEILLDFIDHKAFPYIDSGKKVRPLADITQSELYKKQKEAQSTFFYQNFEAHLNKWDLPEKEEIQDFFGEYTDIVLKNFKAFNDLKKTRSCDLPYTKHLLRNVVMAHVIGFDNNSGKPSNYYKTVWALHDSVEELVYSIRDEKGRMKYGLDKIPQFLDDFIPTEMQEDVLMVTNKSDLILKYLDSKNYSLRSKQEMMYGLNALLKSKKYDYLRSDVLKMKDILKKANIPSGRDAFFEDAKWEFYDKIFINDLGEQAYKTDHLALFEGKGILDLFDNYVGRHARKLEDRRRSIQKMERWVRKSEKLLERARNEGRRYEFFERKVLEAMNHANYGAREMLINYLAQPMSNIDHLRSALVSIEQFKRILYVRDVNNRTPNL